MMELSIETNKIDWWFWAITLAFISLLCSDGFPAYYVVMVIQRNTGIIFCQMRWQLGVHNTGTDLLFCKQLLLHYGRNPFSVVHATIIGYCHGDFTGRCVLALMLKKMPWNKDLPEGASVAK